MEVNSMGSVIMPVFFVSVVSTSTLVRDARRRRVDTTPPPPRPPPLVILVPPRPLLITTTLLAVDLLSAGTNPVRMRVVVGVVVFVVRVVRVVDAAGVIDRRVVGAPARTFTFTLDRDDMGRRLFVFDFSNRPSSFWRDKTKTTP